MSDYSNHDSTPALDCATVDGVPTTAIASVTRLDLGLGPELLHAVASALSRTVLKTRSKDLPRVYDLARALSLYGQTSVANSPCLGESASASEASTRMKRMETTAKQLQTVWRAERDEHGFNATLDATTLLGLFDPPFWRLAASFIQDGPGLAAERTEKMLRDLAQQQVEPTRARPEGGVTSRSYLDNLAGAVGAFMDALVELRVRGHASCDVLATWGGRPRISVPDAPRDVTDTTAPPLRLVRLAWAKLDAEIEATFGAPLDQQLVLVPTLNTTQQTRLFQRLRNRAAFALLVCTGSRRTAMCEVTVGDCVMRRRSDGSIGRSVGLTPRKTLSENEVRHKPLPDGLATCIDVYLAFLELRLGRPQPPDAPLLIPSLTRPDKAWAPSSMGQWLSGKDSAGSTRKRAFLPKSGEYYGYTPHTLRSACTQAIRNHESEVWLEQRRLPSDTVYRVAIAEALTDHETMSMDRFGYGGTKKNSDREKLAAIGIEMMWDLLTTDAGARKVYNVADFRSALHKRRALEGERQELRRQRLALSARPDGGADLLALFLEAQRLASEKDEVDDALHHLRDEIEAIRNNRTRLVCVPDELEVPPVVDLDAVEREILGGVVSHERHVLRPVRTWLFGAELADCLGRGPATVRRWMDGKLPTRAQDRPWATAEEAPIDSSLSEKRRRIYTPDINPELFNTPLKQQRRAEHLARWPEGMNERAKETPLVIPRGVFPSEATAGGADAASRPSAVPCDTDSLNNHYGFVSLARAA